jgi:segregation and condensation protein B
MIAPDPDGGADDRLFDAELADLPPEARWREWMGRVEAAVFASAEPAPREALARLVGRACVLDDLIADIRHELKGRPYDLVFVAGGFHHRTRPRFADAVRAAAALPGRGEASGAGSAPGQALTQLEMLVLAAIAYRQPVTRAALCEALGRDVSRDILARLKRIGLVGGGPRAPFPGAPLTYVTTPLFLSVFGLASLRDLPEIEGIQGDGPRDEREDSLAPVFGGEADAAFGNVGFDGADDEKPLAGR